MSVNFLEASAAYARALKRPVQPSDAGMAMGGAAGQAQGGGFGSLVEELATEAVQATRQAEAVSRQTVTGKADLVDVVTAVTAAETALETVVAVRDRVVSAYQELMRMQI